MKKRIIYLFGLLILALMPISIFAEEELPLTTMPQNDTFVAEQNLFQVDDKLNLSGEFNGTSFFVGSSVISNSVIRGLSFVAGESLDLRDTSEYSFYAGNLIKINGLIQNDLFVAGNTIIIDKNASIGRDAYIAGSSVDILGNIGRNCYIAADEIIIDNSIIDGSITLDANKITLGENVTINGTFKYNGDSKITGLDDASIGLIQIYQNVYNNNETNVNDSVVLSIIFSILTNTVLGLVLCLVIPKVLNKIAKDDSNIIGKIGRGLVFMIIVPIICIILMISIFGIKLSFIGICAYIIIMLLSKILTDYFIGNLIYTKLLKRKQNIYLSMVIGIVIMELISYVPYIGGLVGFLSMLLGIGIVLNLLIFQKQMKK